MSGSQGLCAGFRAGECGACVLAPVRRSLAVGARSFPERRRRRRGPDSSTAPHRNSPWSDRRGLAGGAAEQQPRRVPRDRSPRAAAALSGPSAASPTPMPSLFPGPRKWRLKLCTENATSGHRVRFLPLTGITVAAVGRELGWACSARFSPVRIGKLGKCLQRHLLPCTVAPGGEPEATVGVLK